MKPLFIPLKREYFEAFESGIKDTEYRPYGPRWNEKTCILGRDVVLSLGYGKQRRLKGIICGFKIAHAVALSGAWQKCYGNKTVVPAAILIKRIEAIST